MAAGLDNLQGRLATTERHVGFMENMTWYNHVIEPSTLYKNPIIALHSYGVRVVIRFNYLSILILLRQHQHVP